MATLRFTLGDQRGPDFSRNALAMLAGSDVMRGIPNSYAERTLLASAKGVRAESAIELCNCCFRFLQAQNLPPGTHALRFSREAACS
jgi:hypothetical protein